MADERDSAFLAGRLLIAMPGIGDPRFERSVIFMCAHSAESAMGLVLNQPAKGVQFSDLLGQLDIEDCRKARPARIIVGGPVERSRGFVLHSRDYFLSEASLAVTPDFAMTASVDILRDMARGRGPDRAVLALGYSGWGPGQLEREIRANGWLIGEPDDEILFGEADAAKWQAALGLLGVDARMLSRAGGKA